MGSLGEKKWVIYIYCIDFPKSALAANQLLSSYTFLRRVATYRQKKQTVLHSRFYFILDSAFLSNWGKDISMVQKVILKSQSSLSPPAFIPAFSLALSPPWQ